MIINNRIIIFNGNEEFLSNFYPTPIYIEGILYPTPEHAFQAMKTFDEDKRHDIASLDSPGKAKRAGRKVTLRSNWEKVKIKVMYDIIKIKFSQEDMKKKLIETGDMFIQEGNTWKDTAWGVDIKTGAGLNILGNLLMIIREEIK